MPSSRGKLKSDQGGVFVPFTQDEPQSRQNFRHYAFMFILLCGVIIAVSLAVYISFKIQD
jgi:hypothetical protein